MKTFISLLLSLASFSLFAQGGQKNFLDQNYVEVTGKAEIKVIPDLIYLRINIREQEKKRGELEQKEKQMISRLQTIGIDVAKDLVIKDLASNFRYRVFAKDDIVLSKEYLLLVRDGKTANRVMG